MRRVGFVTVNLVAQFVVLIFVATATRDNRAAQAVVAVAVMAASVVLFLVARRARRKSVGLG